jgi:hypothetical protein
MGALIAGALGEFSPATFAFAVAAVFLAAILRGFTGFGFALMAVPALALVLPPAEVVPCTLLMPLVAGLDTLRKAWRQADWPSLKPLLLGALAVTPVGVYVLSILPVAFMRAGIGIIVLLAALLFWRGPRFKLAPSRLLSLGVGGLSGFLTGGTAMGGPPVILYYMALPAGLAVGRASLFVFFTCTTVATVAVQATGGLITARALVVAALLLPAVIIGNTLGDRGFDRAGAATYRRVALGSLAVAGAAALLRAFF